MTGHGIESIPDAIEPGTVHLWLVTGIAAVTEDLARGFLTGAELDRADRLAPEPAHRYLATRALLRACIGRYLGLEPHAVIITRGPCGKPYAVPGQADDLMFNLSGTGNAALYGFSRAGEIGVDLERRDRRAATDRVARRAMTPGELEHFRMLSEADRREAFFTTWTRKEAFLKSIGTGLTFPMRRVIVRGQSPQLVTFPGEPPPEAGDDDWWVADIRMFGEYYAAIALPVPPPAPLTGMLDAATILRNFR